MIRCLTLIDLGSEHYPNKNWISLQQSLSLCCKYEVTSFPKKVYRNIQGLDFGEQYVGFHNVWIFDFNPDEKIVLNELEKIVQYLPIICGLNETIEYHNKCALTDTEFKNISFLYM